MRSDPRIAIAVRELLGPRERAIVDGERTLSHGEVERAAGALAGAMVAAGVRAGDVVSWQAPNWWESVVVALAAWRIGAINNPVLPIYREHELGQIFEDVTAQDRLRDLLLRAYRAHAQPKSDDNPRADQ